MLRKVIALLLLISLLAVSFGCESFRNTSNLSAMSFRRRLAIAGEDLRLVGEDVDRLLGVENYQRVGKYDR